MSKKISVIIKEPGKNPRHVNISDSHKNLEKTVGGTVAEIILCTDLVVLFRQEQEGLPRCCNIAGKELAGTVVFCGIGHPDEDAPDELIDIPQDFKTFKTLFPRLWEK